VQPLGTHLRLLAFVLPAMGCVLLVPDVAGDGTCRFEGETPCAACIRTRCQPGVDACCGDEACSGDDGHGATMAAIDACGSGNKDACASGFQNASPGAGVDLRACVASECQATCLEGATVTVPWTCDSPRTEEGACATCIYASCEDALDGCCGDRSCQRSREIQRDMSACVSGDEAGCAYLLSRSDFGLEGVLRGCIAKSCAAKCLGDGRPHNSCGLFSAGAYCSCSDAEESSGPECSVAAVGGHCVRGRKGCSCGAYSCGATSHGCSCDFRGKDEELGTSCQLPARAEEGRCCLKVSDTTISCECTTLYTFACDSDRDEYSTSSCDLDVLLERIDALVVDRCSR
jgi:hypothetical protein